MPELDVNLPSTRQTQGSIKDKIDKSLDALKKMEGQMDRLANATDLTSQEKKTRRAIAIIAKTVDKNIEKPADKENK